MRPMKSKDKGELGLGHRVPGRADLGGRLFKKHGGRRGHKRGRR